MTTLHHYNLQEIKNEEIILKVNNITKAYELFEGVFNADEQIETWQCVVIVSHSGSVRLALK